MSITAASRERRARLADREVGFTLIELLVVVIIIGVLAAIAIPVYVGAQNNAKDTAVKSDLTSAKIAVLAYYSTNNSWSKLSSTASVNAASTQTAGAGGFKKYGWGNSAAVDGSSTAGGSAESFCIKLQSTSTGSPWYYVTHEVSPTASKPDGCA